MVQVFDPTDGNMTPCTESLRYSNYAIKNCGFNNGGRCLYICLLSSYCFSYYKFSYDLLPTVARHTTAVMTRLHHYHK